LLQTSRSEALDDGVDVREASYTAIGSVGSPDVAEPHSAKPEALTGGGFSLFAAARPGPATTSPPL
jgi:hypothetical protein